VGLGRRGTHALRRHWVLGLVAAVVVVGGVGAWLTLRPDAATTTTITATAASGTFRTTVTADGTITPSRTSDLTFPSGGTVSTVLATEGEKVTKGEVLARMDASALTARRDAASATLDAAQTQLDDDVDADASDTQLASDRASVASAASDLSTAQDDVDGATLKAPFTGTVSAVGLAVGDSTGSSTSGGGGTTTSAASTTTTTAASGSTSAITVISTSSYVVDASVGSSDLAQLKKGLQVEITPTGSTAVVYGVVETVGVIAQSSGTGTGTGSTGAATFPVTIRITGSTKGLYAGSSASVSIIVKQVENVLTVPTQAVTTKSGKTYVSVVKNGKVTRTAITIGQTYGAQTEVTEGLSAGDTVQLAGFTAPGGTNRARTGTGNRPGGFPQGGAGGAPPAGFGGGQ
jgi:multidrug efflux pump subunit AcrA (membrane-fusion protein)